MAAGSPPPAGAINKDRFPPEETILDVSTSYRLLFNAVKNGGELAEIKRLQRSVNKTKNRFFIIMISNTSQGWLFVVKRTRRSCVVWCGGVYEGYEMIIKDDVDATE